MNSFLARIAILAAVSVLSLAVAGEVAAEETAPSSEKEQATTQKKAPSSNPQEKPQQAKGTESRNGAASSPATPAPKPQPPKAVEPAGSGDDDFVDRDGDGIQDGKEHRFRRNKGSRDKKTRRTDKRRGNAAKKRGGKSSGN